MKNDRLLHMLLNMLLLGPLLLFTSASTHAPVRAGCDMWCHDGVLAQFYAPGWSYQQARAHANLWRMYLPGTDPQVHAAGTALLQYMRTHAAQHSKPAVLYVFTCLVFPDTGCF
jgi:hypothetical protein